MNSPNGSKGTASRIDRRRFLQLGAASSLGIAGLAGAASAIEGSPQPGGKPAVRRYRTLGRTGLEVSDISFGASRLRAGGEQLIHHAMDRGINYFDTAESYTRGQSEQVIGKALAGRRDQVILASKQFAGARTRHPEMMTELENSLRRLRTDVIDVYFNHAVNDVDRLRNAEWFEFVDKARAQGKIRFTGMSGHAGYLIDCLDLAVDEGLVDVVLAAYNFGQDPAFYENITRGFDFVANQPDLPRVLAKAKAKGIGVIAMKTLMGARLNDMRPYESNGSTFSQAAFRWVLANADVDALIVSMTDTTQIDEYLGASGAQRLAGDDLNLLRRYAALTGTTYCKHACNACESACPYGVPIADVLRTRMYATDYQDVAFARAEYAALDTNADACLSCDGTPCSGACPHAIPIADLCAPTHRMLA